MNKFNRILENVNKTFIDENSRVELEKPIIEITQDLNPELNQEIVQEEITNNIELTTLFPTFINKHLTVTEGITAIDCEFIEEGITTPQARGFVFNQIAKGLEEVRTRSGGVGAATLGELENVDTLVDLLEDNTVLGVKDGLWRAVKSNWLETGEINGIPISTVKDLIDYLEEYGFSYPEKNTPPRVNLKDERFIFKVDDEPIISFNVFDKEGGTLKVEVTLPESLGSKICVIENLKSGDVTVNLNTLIYGEGSTSRLLKGNYNLSLTAIDALGRKSIIPVTLGVIVGGITLQNNFNYSLTYPHNQNISMPFGIQSVFTNVKLFYEVGGNKFIVQDGIVREQQLGSEKFDSEIVLTNNETTNPDRFYQQEYTLPAKNENGEYVVNVYATSLDENVVSNTISMKCVILNDQIIYVKNNINNVKSYNINNSYNVPINVYSKDADDAVSIELYFQTMEDDVTLTEYSTNREFNIVKVFPEDAALYNIITKVKTTSNKLSNVSNVPINVENPSYYSVLTGGNYNLELYLSARGKDNEFNNLDEFNNKRTLNQEYIGKMYNYVPKVNGWEKMNGEDQLTGNCLHSSNGAYTIVNYQPFKDFSKKSNIEGNGLTLELVVHNTDYTDNGLYNFTIGDPSNEFIKGITMDNEWMRIYYAVNKYIELPVACEVNHFTQSGDWVPQRDEYVHLTIVYDVYSRDILAYVNGGIAAVGQFGSLSDIENDYKIVINGYINSNGDVVGIGEEKIKTIRVYQKALNQDDVLNNYIADITYEEDRIQNELVNDEDKPFLTQWKIDGNRFGCTDEIPVFLDTVVTPGSEYKLYNEKLISPLADGNYSQEYMDWSKPHVTEIVWQGNSSLAYPVKNYAIDDVFNPENTEKNESKKFFIWKNIIDGLDQPYLYSTDEWHLKTNYIDSSQANNQGIAKIANNVWKVPYNWTNEEYVKYLGTDKPFPIYNVEGNRYSKYPIPVTRLAIDGVPFYLMSQNLDASGNLMQEHKFSGLYTWNTKQNEQLYGMKDYKEDVFHKNTIWRSESNGDSVHPQLRSWSYGFFNGYKKSLKIDNLSRPLTDEYIQSQGLIEGVDYIDLDKPENASLRENELKWRVGAEMVMDWECRNPKSLGTGVWEEFKDGKWTETTNLLSDYDLDKSLPKIEKQLRWRWTEVDELNYPIRKKGEPSVGYWEDMLDYNTLIPNLSGTSNDQLHPETRALVNTINEEGGSPAINKSLGEVATKQHLDFIEAMRFVEDATDESFADPLILGKYFHVQSLCDYVIMSITFWLQDQLGRNLTMVQFDNREVDYEAVALSGISPFYAVMYDMDTAFGTNVQGTLETNPYKGWQYPIKGKVFGNLYTPAEDGSDFSNYNCALNLIFKRFSALYGDMLVRRYRELRDGVRGLDNITYEAPLTYNNILSLYQKEIAGRYGQRMYNKDAVYKYIGEKYDSTSLRDEKRKYLVNARGSKIVFMKNFVKKRLEYVDSLFKYESDSDSIGDMTYLQHRYQGLFELELKTSKPAYLRVSFAQNQSSSVYCDGINSVKVSYYYTGDSEKILRIYNSNKLTVLNGLVNKSLTKAKLNSLSNVKELDLSNNPTLNELIIDGCKSLQKLVLNGVNNPNGLAVNFSNNYNLRHLDISNSSIDSGDFNTLPYLEYLDISNCSMSVINLNGCSRLKTFLYAGINPIELYLDDCGLSMDLSDGNNWDKLTKLQAYNNRITDIGTINKLQSLKECYLKDSLELIGISGMNNVKVNSDFLTNSPKLENVIGLFEGNGLITNFFEFKNCPKITNISRLYKNCVNLVGPITTTSLDSLTALTNMTEAFSGCSELIGTVKDYWTDNKYIGNNTFKGCYKLTNYKNVPEFWGGLKVISFFVIVPLGADPNNTVFTVTEGYGEVTKISNGEYEVKCFDNFKYKIDNIDAKPYYGEYNESLGRVISVQLEQITSITLNVSNYNTLFGELELIDVNENNSGIKLITKDSNSKFTIKFDESDGKKCEVKLQGDNVSSTNQTIKLSETLPIINTNVIVKGNIKLIFLEDDELVIGRNITITDNYTGNQQIIPTDVNGSIFLFSNRNELNINYRIQGNQIAGNIVKQPSTGLNTETVIMFSVPKTRYIVTNYETTVDITSYTGDLIIDWGDGTTTVNPPVGPTKKNYGSSGKQRKVTITCDNYILNKLNYVDELISFCANNTLMNSMFSYSTIKKVHKGAFDTLVNVTSFYCCFEYCQSLMEIPEGLFDYNVNVTNFRSCFSNCSSLNQPYNLTSQGKKKLWERNGDAEGAKVKESYNFAYSAHPTFRATIPTTWGGTMTPVVTITVKDDVTKLPMSGVEVTINTTTIVTDTYGKAQFQNINSGVYTIKLVNGDIEINKLADIYVDNTLGANIELLFTASETVYLTKSETTGLRFRYISPDCFIDWGDGTITTDVFTLSTWNNHTYSDGLTEHTVRIIGDHILYYYNDSSSYSSNYQAIKGMHTLEVLNSSNTNLNSSFCNSDLVIIKQGAFDKMTQLTTMNSCFYTCKTLTTIPDGLFDQLINIHSFSNCFSNCQSLIEVPEGLFDYNTQVTTFSNCFYSCYGLTTIPKGLFDKLINVTNFNACFNYASAVSFVPEGLFDYNTKVTNFSACFRGCDKLDQEYNLTSPDKKKLWERNNDADGVIVTSYSSFADNAHSTFRSTIPSTWGGTMEVTFSATLLADNNLDIEFVDADTQLLRSIPEPIKAVNINNGKYLARLTDSKTYNILINKVKVDTVVVKEGTVINLTGEEVVSIDKYSKLLERLEALENRLN